MKFNPQTLMQMMMQRNPQLMQQFQQFQQAMQTNPQMQQQYIAFRNNIANNPQAQKQAFEEAMNKVNNLPPVGGQAAGNSTDDVSVATMADTTQTNIG